MKAAFVSLISFSFFIMLQFPTYGRKKEFVPKFFKAQFIQEYKSGLNGKVKRGLGVIEYMYPGRIRLEMLSPDKVIFVSNPLRTYYYTPPLFDDMEGDLKIEKTKKTSLSYFFDLLKFGPHSNKYYKVISKKSGIELHFVKEVAKKMQLKKATLRFKSSARDTFDDLKAIDLVYLDKKQVTIKLKKIETSVSFKKDYFQFKAPAAIKKSSKKNKS